MIYDGETKNLILIQITINKNHDIHYDTLEKLIKSNDLQLKPGERKKYEKHKNFFQCIKELVSKYFFQWMTNKKYDELIQKSDKAKENMQDPNFFQIIPFDKNLIDEIG